MRRTVTAVCRGMQLWAGLGLLAACGTLAAQEAGADGPLQKFEFLQIRMGMPVAIQVYAPAEDVANKAADDAYARFKQLDRTLSDYDPDSELMQLCRNARAGEAVAVSQDLAFVLTRAQQLARRTDGAFDVTIGPVVDLWRRARRKKEAPAAEELHDALQRVGYSNLEVDCEAQTVRLLKSGMRLDLGGIAVGYAVDEAIRTFREHGLTRVLIDASGDIAGADPPPGRAAWRVEIEHLAATEPDADTRAVLYLKNCAVTTSGDAYKYVELDGVRYSHIVDPKTGLGVTRRSSATVIAPDCITADSVATAVSVLGPERGLELVAGIEGAAAYIEYAEGDEVLTRKSGNFDEYLATPQPGDPAQTGP
jgi:FAD:protein FMN transferase